MEQVLEQVTNLMIPKFVARKPIIRRNTYKKFGFVVTLRQYCYCPRCNQVLNAGPDYQPKYCGQCGQHVDFSDVVLEREIELGTCKRGDN